MRRSGVIVLKRFAGQQWAVALPFVAQQLLSVSLVPFKEYHSGKCSSMPHNALRQNGKWRKPRHNEMRRLIRSHPFGTTPHPEQAVTRALPWTPSKACPDKISFPQLFECSLFASPAREFAQSKTRLSAYAKRRMCGKKLLTKRYQPQSITIFRRGSSDGGG